MSIDSSTSQMSDHEYLLHDALALVEAQDSGDEDRIRWARYAYDQGRFRVDAEHQSATQVQS